jgi:hypothetical protein
MDIYPVIEAIIEIYWMDYIFSGPSPDLNRTLTELFRFKFGLSSV